MARERRPYPVSYGEAHARTAFRYAPLRALKDAQVWLSNSTGTRLAEVLRSLRLPQEAMRRSCSRSLESGTAVAGPLQSFGRGGIRVYWVQI